MKKLLTAFAVLGLALAIAGAAHASSSPAYTVDSINTVGVWQNASQQTTGWRFTVASSLEVTDLGVWDKYGLSFSHEVGIWDVSTSTLLVSGTVASGGAGTHQDLDFLYVPVTPTTLLAGHSYVIGAHYFVSQDDWEINPYVVTWNSAVTYDSTARSLYTTNSVATEGSLLEPTTTWGTNIGTFGPNFESKPVPIPAALLLLGPGLMGIGALRRKSMMYCARYNMDYPGALETSALGLNNTAINNLGKR